MTTPLAEPPVAPAPATATAPIPVQPLAYADAIDDGWETPVRLTLWAAAIYHAISAVTALAQAGFTYGQYARTPAPLAGNLGAAAYVLVHIASAVVAAGVAIACVAALTRRTEGLRRTIVWGAGFLAAARLGLSMVQFAGFMLTIGPSQSMRNSFGAIGFAGYVLSAALSPIAGVVFPVLIIVLLTRPGARRVFMRDERLPMGYHIR